jgi:acetolactate decarboxylase
MVNLKKILCGLILFIAGCASPTPPSNTPVKIVGAIRNVMWKGELHANIDLDTIANKRHLYGLGPLEYLGGELMIIDGKAYKSTVASDSTLQVEETFLAKAPFFGYANIEKWAEHILPDSVQTAPQLEAYLYAVSKSTTTPFLFRLKGTIETALIHVVNLPKHARVNSPAEAHKGQKNYRLKTLSVDILGFFSTKHKAIFTHHNTYLHMHLITHDKSKMGHVDDVVFKQGGMKYYLPVE